jgi:uncharacterized protein with GYD domain
VFTYVGLIQLTPEGRENLEKTPVYLDKIRKIVEEEGGVLDQVYALMGPWDFITFVKYPDTETAFRVLVRSGCSGWSRPRRSRSSRSRSSRRLSPNGLFLTCGGAALGPRRSATRARDSFDQLSAATVWPAALTAAIA